jgi:hypothetical protein
MLELRPSKSVYYSSENVPFGFPQIQALSFKFLNDFSLAASHISTRRGRRPEFVSRYLYRRLEDGRSED